MIDELPTPHSLMWLPEEARECLGVLKQHLMKAGKERYDFPIMY